MKFTLQVLASLGVEGLECTPRDPLRNLPRRALWALRRPTVVLRVPKVSGLVGQYFEDPSNQTAGY